ncbi:MAG: malonyl-CoA synthase [Hyphomicrobiales bacterium]|nr:malonyl-CoA synthase [Hyphomicrobiales bacterium]
MSSNLFDLLQTATTDVERTVITTPEGARLSYGDLFAMTAQMAHVLVKNGVKPGDRIAAQVEKSVPALVL